ncbi:hypothetical protein [Achromobacter pulmonis]|nr:hypothetical protein [Achromobacter pulmonis]
MLTKDGRARLEIAQPDYEKALEVALKEHEGEKLLATQGLKVR